MKTTQDQLTKIPGVPCLYRHNSGQYYARKKVRGKIKSSALGTSDRKLAERKLSDWISGLNYQKSEITLEELSEKFLSTNVDKALSTVRGYHRAITILLKHFPSNTFAHKVKPSQIAEILSHSLKTFSPSTHNHLSSNFGKIFALALNDGQIPSNPIDKLEKRLLFKNEKRKPPTIPTQEQFQSIVNHIRTKGRPDVAKWHGDYAEFLGLSALGEAEASNLLWSDVDWKEQKIYIKRQKTGQHFYIPFFPWLQPFLERIWKDAGEPTGGNIFKPVNMYEYITRICKRMKLPPMSPRSIRQMGIVNQIRAGLPIKLVAKYQGHQDGGKLILDTYSEVISSGDAEYEKKIIANLKN